MNREEELQFEDPHEGDIDMSLLRYALSLTPTERWRQHARALAMAKALRKAGESHYGHQPSTAENSSR
jgi:hypothetical protein